MKNIVEGIDLIIKGLEIIKENFKTQKLIMSDEEKEKISKAQEVEEEIEEIEVEDTKEVEESEIEESEEVEDEGYTREELEGMKYTELKSLAKDLGVSASGKKVDLIDKILESQSQEVEEPEVEDIAEEYGLNDMTLEELADICAEYGLSTKGKKQALIDRIVKAIANGEIEVDDEEEEEVYEEEEEEDEEEEDEEEAEEETKKKPLRSLKNTKREEKEKEVEENIREQYRKKKLKDSTIQKFLDNYNEGDPECKGCKGCTKEDMLDCYIDIHKALVDDDGEVNDMEEPYIRDNEYHCCGKELEELENGNYYCSVCGQEYED